MKNIAEILKNAPSGLKLYTPLCGEVEFDFAREPGEYPISVLYGGGEENFDKYGKYFSQYGECSLFPSKDHRTWDNWQEVLMSQCVGSVFVDNNEYQYCLVTNDKIWVIDKLRKSLTGWFTFSVFNFNQELRFATDEETKLCFNELERQGYKFENGEVVKKEKEWSIFDAKDGDFVYDMYNETIFIFKEINSQKALMEYVSYPTPLDFLVQMKSNGNQHSTLGNYYDEKKYRLATTEEVQLLLCKLNDAGYYWDENNKEVKKIEKKFTINNFKPFDKVLVRDCSEHYWTINLFSHYEETSDFPYKCLSCCFMQCVPYNEETAHLLDTTKKYNGPYKTWED